MFHKIIGSYYYTHTDSTSRLKTVDQVIEELENRTEFYRKDGYRYSVDAINSGTYFDSIRGHVRSAQLTITLPV